MNYKCAGVYCILNLRNKKKYIGSSKNVLKRLNDHQKALKAKTHCNCRLQRAWNKDKKHFLFLFLQRVRFEENLLSREQYWMDYFETADSSYGYNINPQAESSFGIVRGRMPESHRKSIQRAHKKRWSVLAHHQKGRKASAETRMKMCEVQRKAAKKRWRNPTKKMLLACKKHSKRIISDAERKKHIKCMANPEVRKKIFTKQRANKIKRTMKKLWATPAFRKRMVSARKGK